MNVSGIDLNQIRALDALLSERSVTRAAVKLGITQAAASNALARLRAHFDDPLLVRAGRKLMLTSRAEALVEPAAEVMRAAERVFLAGPPFDPGKLSAAFRIATSDHVELVILRGVETLLAEEAPGVDIHAVPFGSGTNDMLRGARVDLAIGPRYDGAADIEAEQLFEDPLVWVMRKGHPALAGPTSAAAFAGLRHLLVSPRGGARGPVDEALAARGLSRRIARIMPHFGAALLTVARSDLVTVVPERLAATLADELGLTYRRAPVPLPPVAIHQLWHRRTANDARHVYLRSVVRRAAPLGTSAR